MSARKPLLQDEEEPGCCFGFFKKTKEERIKPRVKKEKGCWDSLMGAPEEQTMGVKDYKIRIDFQDRHSKIIADQEERKAKLAESKNSTSLKW